MTNIKNTVLYTGITNNLVKRIYEYKNEFVDGFTKKYNIKKIVYYEIFKTPLEEIDREKQIKAGSRKKKISLIIKENPNFEDLYKKII